MIKIGFLSNFDKVDKIFFIRGKFEFQARVLKGNEGSLFHPFVKRDETLWTFSNQLCR